MDNRGATVRRAVQVDVPAHVAYERMCRVEEYPLFRPRVRQITALSEATHRWELVDTAFTARLDERQPDELLRWHCVDGPACAEQVTVQALSPRRSVVVIESSGPAALLGQLVADLDEFKRHVERDHPAGGHHVNERPALACRHRPNWRDSRMW